MLARKCWSEDPKSRPTISDCHKDLIGVRKALLKAAKSAPTLKPTRSSGAMRDAANIAPPTNASGEDAEVGPPREKRLEKPSTSFRVPSQAGLIWFLD